MATRAPVRPHLACQGCKAEVDLRGLRVGDSARCPACQHLNVITRSLARGEVPPARRQGALSSHEAREVQDALARIKRRRRGRASQHASLYPSWAILLSVGQFYLAGILAGANLMALGEPARGRRMQSLATVAYVLLGALYAGAALSLPPAWIAQIPAAAVVAALAAPPLGFGLYYTSVQARASAGAREAGATTRSPLLPLLVGLILAIAQAFAVWFLVELRPTF